MPEFASIVENPPPPERADGSRYSDPMDLVFLHGPAASGKLTVGRELARLTGMPLFHNHLVVDALLALFPFGSPEFVQLREEYWLRAFAAAASADRSFIFTFAPEQTVPAGFAQRALSTVGASAGRVHFVALQVSSDEQERRIENADRKQFNKLSQLDTLRRIRAVEKAEEIDVPPADLTIDTATNSPAEAARVIRDRFELPRVEQSVGYPAL